MKIDDSLFVKIVLALAFGWIIYHLYKKMCSCQIEGVSSPVPTSPSPSLWSPHPPSPSPRPSPIPSPGPPPPPPPLSTCLTTMKKYCRNRSKPECLMCLGTKQQIMRKAGCKQSDFNIFCNI